jgi:hypothetical protein
MLLEQLRAAIDALAAQYEDTANADLDGNRTERVTAARGRKAAK